VTQPDKRWDLDLPFGQFGEEMLRDILCDKSSSQIEVKRDRMVGTTGNLAIEYECNGVPSGIATTKAKWWGYILSGPGYEDEVITMMPTARCKRIARRSGLRRVTGGDGNRAKMVLVPLSEWIAPEGENK